MMSRDTIQLVATYVIATLVLAGAFALIWAARGDSGQAWLAIGAILGYVFRDSGGASATRSAIAVAAAQPGAGGGTPVTPPVPQP